MSSLPACRLDAAGRLHVDEPQSPTLHVEDGQRVAARIDDEQPAFVVRQRDGALAAEAAPGAVSACVDPACRQELAVREPVEDQDGVAVGAVYLASNGAGDRMRRFAGTIVGCGRRRRAGHGQERGAEQSQDAMFHE
jgi:hypothetical protein